MASQLTFSGQREYAYIIPQALLDSVPGEHRRRKRHWGICSSCWKRSQTSTNMTVRTRQINFILLVPQIVSNQSEARTIGPGGSTASRTQPTGVDVIVNGQQGQYLMRLGGQRVSSGKSRIAKGEEVGKEVSGSIVYTNKSPGWDFCVLISRNLMTIFRSRKDVFTCVYMEIQHSKRVVHGWLQ